MKLFIYGIFSCLISYFIAQILKDVLPSWHERYIAYKRKKAIKNHEEWARQHQKPGQMQAIEGSGHLGGTSKEELDKAFKELPGG